MGRLWWRFWDYRSGWSGDLITVLLAGAMWIGLVEIVAMRR